MASPEVTRWCAVPGVLQAVPGQAARHGMQAQYVGRTCDQKAHEAGETDPDKLYPIADENAAFYRKDGQGMQSELLRLAKFGAITPADDVTANWAGVATKTTFHADKAHLVTSERIVTQESSKKRTPINE